MQRQVFTALALVTAACTGSSGGAAPARTTAVPPATGTVAASGDIVAVDGRAVASGQELRMADGTVVVTFPRLSIDPDCLTALELELHVVAGGGERLLAYPSLESKAHTFADGTPVGAVVLRHNRPRAESHVPEAPGTARWDVLTHYRIDPTVTGSGHSPDEHFAIGIRPASGIQTSDAVFAASESGRPPVLRWTAPAGCA